MDAYNLEWKWKSLYRACIETSLELQLVSLLFWPNQEASEAKIHIASQESQEQCSALGEWKLRAVLRDCSSTCPTQRGQPYPRGPQSWCNIVERINCHETLRENRKEAGGFSWSVCFGDRKVLRNHGEARRTNSQNNLALMLKLWSPTASGIRVIF